MNIQALMQQAQKMQKKIADLDTEFKKEIFSTEAGGGVIKIKINGDMKLVDVVIEDDLLSGDDKEMVQDLFIAAVNQGIDTVRREKEARMGKVMGKLGAGMPGMF